MCYFDLSKTQPTIGAAYFTYRVLSAMILPLNNDMVGLFCIGQEDSMILDGGLDGASVKDIRCFFYCAFDRIADGFTSSTEAGTPGEYDN